MSRGKHKEKKEPFISIPSDILKSKAWEEIGNAAKVAYIHILGEVHCPDPGWLDKLTYERMRKFMSEPTFSKAIKELEKVGLIDKKQIGQVKKKNLYKPSSRWKGHGVFYNL